mgnify:CR=1 FL=1
MKFIKQITWITLLLISAATISPVLTSPNDSYNIVGFGAVGTGKILDTRAIQAAVDECSKNGGGTVYFPAGKYLSGTIYMKDNVNLNISIGAILLGSVDVNDFPQNKCDFPSYSDNYVSRALIWGEGLKNISISGMGTIDGQGAAFKDNKPNESELEKLVTFFDDTTRYSPEARYINRPYIIRFISCSDIQINGITMRNSPMWMQQYLNCDYLSVKNITVYNHGSINNDMIDVDCCRNVVISDCFGDSADDALTLKSTGAFPTENVTITNCVLSSFCNVIKMGTESSGGFKNISITNCIIRPSSEAVLIYGRKEGLAGIALEIVDGGILDGVTISNITITGTTAPIFMRLGNRARQYQPTIEKPEVGIFRNVVVSNIVASSAQITGCSITGIPDHPIENVTLSNIKINFVGGGTKLQAETEVQENEDKYPESTMFGILPASGFYCRHVEGLTFRDVDIDFNHPEERPALVCDDVHNLKLFNFTGKVTENASAQIILRNSNEVFISECQPPKMAVFLRLEDNSDHIKIIGNDLSRVNRPFVLDESVQMTSLNVGNNFSDKLTLFAMLEPLITIDDFGKVTIKSFTTDSEIRYTLDGSEVTKMSKEYSTPFTKIGVRVVKAKVFKNEMTSSSAILKISDKSFQE